MAKRRKVSNLLGLAIMALLVPGTPMHPYQMASVLRQTGKERDMKIKWGSLYTVVQNLEKHGFIEATSSGREGRRPERTVYAITDEGRAELKDWLHELVSEPEAEFPKLQAALSVIGVLHPDEVTQLLSERLRVLDADIAEQKAVLAESAHVPRLFLIEAEFALTMREAEAAWVRALQKDLADGTLDDIGRWREFHETGAVPAEWSELLA